MGAWDHIRLANSSPAGIEEVEADGKTVRRGLGDTLSRDAVRSSCRRRPSTGADVDPQMVRLATMNLTLRGLDTGAYPAARRADPVSRPGREGGTGPAGACGFDVILANPPFSGRLDRDRIVEDVKIGRTGQTELLFLQYMLQPPEGRRTLRGRSAGGRAVRLHRARTGNCGAELVENNTVEAVLSLPSGVFNPYSGVKTSVLVFRKGGATGHVMFLHADNDGFKLDANHDQPIEADDLPDLIGGVP